MTDAKRADAARKASKGIREFLLGYRALMEDASRAEALTLPQFRLLHAVAEHHDDSAAALSRLCQVTPQTFQAMLTRAEREGWITRAHADRNQRITTARLTPKGRAVLRRGMNMAQRIESRLWQGVPLARLNAFNEILDCGLASLRAELQTEPSERPKIAGTRRVKSGHNRQISNSRS